MSDSASLSDGEDHGGRVPDAGAGAGGSATVALIRPMMPVT